MILAHRGDEAIHPVPAGTPPRPTRFSARFDVMIAQIPVDWEDPLQRWWKCWWLGLWWAGSVGGVDYVGQAVVVACIMAGSAQFLLWCRLEHVYVSFLDTRLKIKECDFVEALLFLTHSYTCCSICVYSRFEVSVCTIIARSAERIYIYIYIYIYI